MSSPIKISIETTAHIINCALVFMIILLSVSAQKTTSQILPITPQPIFVQVNLPVLSGQLETFSTKITISGRLTDTDGEALIGANIIVMELKVGSSTDTEGNYSFEVPVHAVGSIVTLMAVHVGYDSVERLIRLDGKSMTERFVLEAYVINMDEVFYGCPTVARPKLKLTYTKAILTTDSDGNLY